MSNYSNKKYDLKERTFIFSKDLIILLNSLNRNIINEPLIKQVVRSGTSIGANYAEADDAMTPRDFKHKISICKKESAETIYFLKVLLVTNQERSSEIETLLAEAKELNLIFNSIFKKLKR